MDLLAFILAISADGITDEQVQTALNAYIAEHPEAVTTVTDGSITKAKLHDDLADEIEQNTADVSGLKSEVTDIEDALFTEESVSDLLTFTKVTGKGINSSGVYPHSGNDPVLYAYELDGYKKITIWAQPLAGNSAYYAFFDADTAAECDETTRITDPVAYQDRTTTTVSVPQKKCFICISAIAGRDSVIYGTVKYKSALDDIDAEINQVSGEISGLADDITNIETGLTETMQTTQILPAGVAVTGNSPNDAAASADTLRVLNGQKATFKGTATKLKFVTPPMNFGFAKPVTLFQFRLSGSTYSEVYRETFIPDGNNVGEFDIMIPVEVGDVFGIGGYCGNVVSGTYGKTLTLTFDENDVSFTASALAGAGDYDLALYDVTVVPDIDVAKKAQISLLDSPLTLMRDWDIGHDCGKNIVDTSKWVYCQVNDSGISRTTTNKVTIAKVQPGVMYSITRGNVNNLAYGDGYVAFLDENGTALSYMSERDMAFTQEMGKCFVTPSNCHYIALNILGRYRRSSDAIGFDDTNTLMVEQGNHNTPYEPYHLTVSSVSGIPIKTPGLKSDVFQYDAPIHLVVMGDSIASDAIDSQLNSLGHWFYPMIEKYSFKTAHDIGVGGACWTHSADTVYAISNLVNTTNNVLTNQVNILIDHIENDGWEVPDVIFIHCGINDRGHALDGDTGTDYGDPDTAFDYDTDYSELPYGDTKLQNLCGAMRFAIELIWRNYPYTKIVMTTPLHTYGASSNTKTKALSQTIKACAAYLGIPVLDLNAESYIYAQMADNYLVDGLHPNVDKGGKLLADIIGHYLIEKFGGKPFFDLRETNGET